MTLPLSSEPMVPFFGGVAISMLLSPSGSGVGGSFPKPESGSVQESGIDTKPLTPTLTDLLSHFGEKLVAQSALPSKCEAKLIDVTAPRGDLSTSRRYISPFSKIPRV